MSKYDAYLVCNEHLSEVKDFLTQFFKEKTGEHNEDESVTLFAPEGNFQINLMKSQSQPLTQNVTFELGSESEYALESFAKKNNTEIKTFLVSEAQKLRAYNYVEVPGPYNICKIKVFYRGRGDLS
ncbi:MAG: hypothetical protein ACYC1K_02590 [Minisyncoccota bacterium]